jgi:hypothetical protein
MNGEQEESEGDFFDLKMRDTDPLKEDETQRSKALAADGQPSEKR